MTLGWMWVGAGPKGRRWPGKPSEGGKQHPVVTLCGGGGGLETLGAGRGSRDWRWSTGAGAGRTVPAAEMRLESVLVMERPGLGDGR